MARNLSMVCGACKEQVHELEGDTKFCVDIRQRIQKCFITLHMNITPITLLGVAGFSLGSVAVAQNLIQNGSFESPSGNYELVPGGVSSGLANASQRS